MTVPSSFDSLVAKIIITGADRTQALQRSRRALAETSIEGMPTVLLPFQQAVLDDPAFVGTDGAFGVHTRWIETEFTGTVEPYQGSANTAEAGARQTFTVEVDGRRLAVTVPGDLLAPARRAAQPTRTPRRSGGAGKPQAAASADLTAPSYEACIVRVAVSRGDEGAEGDLIVVLRAHEWSSRFRHTGPAAS